MTVGLIRVEQRNDRNFIRVFQEQRGQISLIQAGAALSALIFSSVGLIQITKSLDCLMNLLFDDLRRKMPFNMAVAVVGKPLP